MGMEHDKDLKSRIDEAFFAIKDLRPDQREDLRRMWRHIRDLWMYMDMEMVNCRKIDKKTPKYQELESKCIESLTNLESYISWAHLLG
jgi:hypothetical protein